MVNPFDRFDNIDSNYRGKRVENKDGSFSTERTITVGIDDKFYNIPTLVDGVEKTPDEAINLFKSGKIKAVGVANTQEEAEAIAKKRSDMIGKEQPNPFDKFDNPKTSWADALKESVSNIPESAVNYGKNLITPFIHPIETAKGAGKLISGLAGKLMPDEVTLPSGKILKTNTENEQFVNTLWEGIKERYGSEDALKKTVSKDPVGIIVDLATLAIPAGKAMQAAGASSGVGALSKAGKLVSKTGAAMEPLNIGTSAIRKTISTLTPEDLPSKLYQSAAKFSTILTKEQRERLSVVALKNDVVPNVKGLDQLRNKISGINDQVTQIIDDIQQSGQTIPIDRLFNEFQTLETDFLKYSGDPISSVKAINKVKEDIIEANQKLSRTELTAKEAQKLKQTIYKELEKEYNKLQTLPAKVEAQMAVARGAKEALEEIVPEIKQLNAKESELINLNNAIERVAARIGNRDVMGIGVPIKGGLGGIVGGYEGASMGLILGMLDTPQIKSRLAIALNKLKRNGIKINETPALSRLLMQQTGKITGLEETNP